MWIITRYGFVSLVAHDTKPDFVRARARRLEHLADTFDLMDADVVDLGPDAPDYRWHADIPKANAAQKMLDAVMDLDYTSHVKENVAGGDHVFYSAMLGCWRELYKLQEPESPVTLGGLGEIAEKVGELADKMLRDKRLRTTAPDAEPPPLPVQDPHDPLPVDIWETDVDVCAVCGDDLNTGDDYVTLPEDAEFGEPAAPAHVACAVDEGWEVTP